MRPADVAFSLVVLLPLLSVAVVVLVLLALALCRAAAEADRQDAERAMADRCGARLRREQDARRLIAGELDGATWEFPAWDAGTNGGGRRRVGPARDHHPEEGRRCNAA